MHFYAHLSLFSLQKNTVSVIIKLKYMIITTFFLTFTETFQIDISQAPDMHCKTDSQECGAQLYPHLQWMRIFTFKFNKGPGLDGSKSGDFLFL